MRKHVAAPARCLAPSLVLLAALGLLAACGNTAPPGRATPRPTAQAFATNPDGSYPCPTCRPTYPAVPMEQDVFIAASDGLEIHGTYDSTDYSPAPAVLLLHQNGGSRQDFTALRLQLRQAGFNVLAVDMRGFGATGGQPDWQKAQDDVVKMLNWLAREPKVNPARMAILGGSVGANLALVVAAKDARVKAVVLLSPGLDYLGVQTEPAAGQYKGPLMLVASSEDTPAAQAVPRLAELHPGDEKTIMLENAGHARDMLSTSPELPGQIIEWLKSAL